MLRGKYRLRHKTAIVVAGGQSLKSFDFSILKGHSVIAVNLAFRVTRPEVICFWDGEFYQEYKDELQQTGAVLATIKQFGPDPYLDQWLPDVNENVNNSGHFAIEMAFQYGAEWVLLLGFDMAGHQSFYDYPSRFRRSDNGQKVSLFDRYGGLPIINCTPGSALYQFPKMDINQALKYYAGDPNL